MDIDIDICRATTGQTANDAWWEARKGRLTASKFGRLMSARGEESLKKLKSEISQPPEVKRTPRACQVGLDEETNAKLAYIRYQREVKNCIVAIQEVGLCVPNWDRSIGSSPDGIVTTTACIIPHILEIKCIYDVEPVPRTIFEVAKDRGSRFYCKIDNDGVLRLKRNHQYYYQILGEMVTTGLLQADFVIYHPRTREILVERIIYNDDDWKAVKARLEQFASI